MSGPPALRVSVAGVTGRDDAWTVDWDVANDEKAAVVIESALLPHGRFRGAEQRFKLRVPSGGSGRIATPASFREAPGTVVENGFLILGVRRGRAAWRVLVRLRLQAAVDGAPRPVPELVTTHRVGFSGGRSAHSDRSERP